VFSIAIGLYVLNNVKCKI